MQGRRRKGLSAATAACAASEVLRRARAKRSSALNGHEGLGCSLFALRRLERAREMSKLQGRSPNRPLPAKQRELTGRRIGNAALVSDEKFNNSRSCSRKSRERTSSGSTPIHPGRKPMLLRPLPHPVAAKSFARNRPVFSLCCFPAARSDLEPPCWQRFS
jgi:hypothetical protein